nr:peptide ABC transporter substrate-binding protein [Entomospira culicis]
MSSWANPESTILRLALPAHQFNWDPQAIEHDDEHILFSAVYQGLVRLDANSLEPLPALAQAWQVSADGLEYRFTLRPKLRFSDGSAITAQSFYRSILRLIDPNRANPNAELLYMIEGVKDYSLGEESDLRALGIEVLNEREILFRLRHPAPYFFEILAHPALSPLSGSQLPLRWSDPRAIPFSGPYLYAGESEDGIILRRNRLYWQADQVEITTIEVHFHQEEASIDVQLTEGKLDWARNLLPSQLTHDHKFLATQRYSSQYYTFVAREGAYAQGTVRRALIKLLPLNMMRDSGMPMAQSLVPPHKDYPTILGINSDYSEGMSLLEQAGYPEAEGLPTLHVLLFSLDDPRALLMQQAWQRAGIDVQLHTLDSSEYYDSSQWDGIALVEQGWSGEYLDPLTFLSLWLTDSRYNQSTFRSAQFDAMIEASHFLTGKERLLKLAQSEALLMASGVVIPMNFLVDREIVPASAWWGFGRNPLGRQRFEYLRKSEMISLVDVL